MDSIILPDSCFDTAGPDIKIDNSIIIKQQIDFQELLQATRLYSLKG